MRKPTRTRELELEIESLTNAGDGLGRVDERVVFVPYTMPGDSVRIKIVQEKKSYVLGQLQEILQTSPNRIEPQCKYFSVCGGCDWQHVPYAEQLSAKTEQLGETLRRIGELANIPVEAIIESPLQYHYRNRIQGEIRDGKFCYNRRRSTETVAIEQCAIAAEPINQFLAQGLDSCISGRVEVAVVNGSVEVLQINDKNSTELGFRQVNDLVSQTLTNLLLKAVEKSGCTEVVDLYCGRGDWAIKIALQHPEAQVHGVDSSEDNIYAARVAASAAKVSNIRFELNKVEKVLSKIRIKDSLCIIDPPRSGLDATVTQALCNQQAQHLLYVSCHPATLARDLKLLTASGYVIKSLQPLDMFPQTAHLECFVHLQSETESLA